MEASAKDRRTGKKIGRPLGQVRQQLCRANRPRLAILRNDSASGRKLFKPLDEKPPRRRSPCKRSGIPQGGKAHPRIAARV